MRKHQPQNRRGTAEIELLVVCPLLILIVLMSLGLMKISIARQDTNRQAMFEAYANATAGGTPEYTGDAALPPLNDLGAISPSLSGFPNRVHDPKVTEYATVLPNQSDSFTATVDTTAAMISPAWTFSAYPVGQSDQQPGGKHMSGITGRANRQAGVAVKLSMPGKIQLDVKMHRLAFRMLHVQAFVFKPGHQVRIAGHAGLHRLFPPWAAPALGLAKIP